MTRSVYAIIPSYDRPDLVEELLRSIEDHADLGDTDLRIRVINKGKGFEREDVMRVGGYKKFDLVLDRMDGLHYVDSVNQAVRSEKGDHDYLMVMNNDISFSHSPVFWLPWMLEALDYHAKWGRAAAIGPVSNHALSEQVTAGLMMSPLLREHAGPACWPVACLSGFLTIWNMPYVYALLDERGHFLHPGLDSKGMDDVEVSLRARKLGGTLWCHGGVYVLHRHELNEKRGHFDRKAGEEVMDRIMPDWREGMQVFARRLSGLPG